MINFLSLYYVVILVELSCFTRTVFFRHVFAFIRFISRILSRLAAFLLSFASYLVFYRASMEWRVPDAFLHSFASYLIFHRASMACAHCIFAFIRFICHISSRFNGLCPLHFCLHSLKYVIFLSRFNGLCQTHALTILRHAIFNMPFLKAVEVCDESLALCIE